MVEGNLANDFVSALDDLEYRSKNWTKFQGIPDGLPDLG
jgi:hypothetical protein